MKKQFIIFSFIGMLASCHLATNRADKWSLEKNIQLSQAGVVVFKHPNVTSEDQSRVDIYFNSKNYFLLDGYMYCNLDSICCLDSASIRIQGCNSRLYKQVDTLEIYYTPNEDIIRKFGTIQLPRITILFKDKADNYYVADTALSVVK